MALFSFYRTFYDLTEIFSIGKILDMSKKRYFKAGSLEEEKFLQECEDKGIDFYKLLDTNSAKRVYDILREKNFKFYPSQATLYRWKTSLKEEKVEKDKIKTKAEEVIDKEIKKELIEEIDALGFLKAVIVKAFNNIDTVTVLDGIKAAEMLIKYGAEKSPQELINAIQEALIDKDDK